MMSVSRPADGYGIGCRYLPSAEIVAAPLKVTVNVPLLTESCVLARFPSTSLVEIVLPPVKAKLVSSVAVILTGTVFTGASFTAVTVIAHVVRITQSGVPAASVLTTTRVSAPL